MGLPKPYRQVSTSTTIPAPTGGLNAYNPISNMPEGDAIMMRNFYPEPYGCMVRKGYVQHAIGFTGNVNSLMKHNGIDGHSKIFAVDDRGVYDVTQPIDTSAAIPIVTTTNSWWQHVNVANAASVHMIAFNGVDDGLWYDGTTMHRLKVAVVPATPTSGEWGGVDPKKLVAPIVHQHRVWAVEKNSTRAWYLPPEQVWGVAVAFDFGGNFTRGGFLQTLSAYTVDSGYGPNDYLAAISSAGEVSLYHGTDPNSPTAWALIGVFYVGATFTRRCTTKFGGDFAMLTQYGMVTMNSVMKPESDSVLNNALSLKIQHLISNLVTEGSTRTGWTVMTYPTANFLLINVPGLDETQNVQLVYNTLTKAWTIFTGMHAVSWIDVQDTLMFGGIGVVCRAWEGNLDNVEFGGNNGTPITAEVQQAFSYFGAPGKTKHFKMFRPTVLYRGKFEYNAGANVDFDFATQPPPANFSTSAYGVWHTSTWDTVYVWSGGAQSDKQWVSIIGTGYTASIRMSVRTNSETTWVATDWVVENGGIL